MPEQLDIMSEPTLYDIFNANCIDDIEMYRKLCSNNAQVLELGIGTGRIAIPLAQNGISVVGIDNSVEMLKALENKINDKKINNIHFYHQNMQSIELDSKFELILCPFCTFNFLLTVDDQQKTLDAVRNLMNKKSQIVFDLLTPNTFPDTFRDGSLKHYDSYLCSNEDSHIEIYTSSKFNQCNQILTQERIFRKYNSSILTSESHYTMNNRLFLLGEFQLLLDKCGYKILDIYGNYRFSAFSHSSKELIIVAALS